MPEETVDISQTDVTLRELFRRFRPGTQVTVTEEGGVVGRFVFQLTSDFLLETAKPVETRERVLGLNRGLVKSMADDFDAPLPDEFWLGGEE